MVLCIHAFVLYRPPTGSTPSVISGVESEVKSGYPLLVCVFHPYSLNKVFVDSGVEGIIEHGKKKFDRFLEQHQDENKNESK